MASRKDILEAEVEECYARRSAEREPRYPLRTATDYKSIWDFEMTPERLAAIDRLAAQATPIKVDLTTAL